MEESVWLIVDINKIIIMMYLLLLLCCVCIYLFNSGYWIVFILFCVVLFVFIKSAIIYLDESICYVFEMNWLFILFYKYKQVNLIIV